ncbi:hypothetical protein Droror1_Dr00002211 [Drosera rotundifolia]
MSSCPFLLRFEERCDFFPLAAFERPRNQAESSSQGDSEEPRERRVSGGHQSKQKFLVDRLNVLDFATKIMETYENHKEIEIKHYHLEFHGVCMVKFIKVGECRGTCHLSSAMRDYTYGL